MNDKTAKLLRKAAALRGAGPAIYAAPEIHHLAEAPVYQTHQRVLRAWDPKDRKIVTRTVEKIMYSKDGRTPLSPLWKFVDKPGTNLDKPEKIHVPQTQLLSITKPIRLKPGTPKAIYRTLKWLERQIGLDAVYAKLRTEGLV